MATSGGGGGVQPELGGRIAARECESCRSAPGIPFCRVEWSFLCGGCAAVVHGHNWIVAVPPNPNPNPNPSLNPNPNPISYPYTYAYPYPVPNPNPNPNPNASGDPNHVVQLSSDEGPSAGDPDDGSSGAAGTSGVRGKRRRRSAGFAAPGGRVASVMRYKEKRKSRKFEKTVRYETRKVYADLRPRVDGKFARTDDGGEETRADVGEAAEKPDASEQLRSDASEEVWANSSDEVGLREAGEEEFGRLGGADEVRLQ